MQCWAQDSFGVKHLMLNMNGRIFFEHSRDLLKPLEDAIHSVLIPALLNCTINNTYERILALPVRLGGLAENSC